MKKGVYFLSIVALAAVFCLFLSSIAYSGEHITNEIYLDELHKQGKERVIVIFKNEIDLPLMDNYQAKVIRTFETTKDIVCEIPQENIEPLSKEESIEKVIPDVLIKIQEGENRQRDAEDFTRNLRLKKEYFEKIRKERISVMDKAREEYLKTLKEYLAKRKPLSGLYKQALLNLQKANKNNRQTYRKLVEQYQEMLRQCDLEHRRALQEYRQKIEMAKKMYLQSASGWREKVIEMRMLSFGGSAPVRWNNLSDGLNSKAAWDNYNLDGSGIKIAFLDTGVNYTLPDLINNYLYGKDFVDGDEEPFTNDPDEYHGTEVISAGIGEGVDQIVGVAYHAKFYAVRVADVSGAFLSAFKAGIEWASTEPHKADIISISLGHSGVGPMWAAYGPRIEQACNSAYNNGIVLVAGSGNAGVSSSYFPAGFDNVISVGAYCENQTIWNDERGASNGGVDIIAPGVDVYCIDTLGDLYTDSGTSMAAPHAAGLIALQLQYARQHNLDLNNGYNWEVMNHSAKDLGLNPTYQGYGKIWAAETDPPPPTPHKGAIDLLTSSIWPFEYTFTYIDYIYLDQDKYPAYFIGTDMVQDITITNITNRPGYTPLYIEQMNVTTIQKYLDTGGTMPGDSTENFSSYEPITLDPGENIVLHDTYSLPWETIPGLDKVVLDLEFKLAGNPRLLKITNNEASIWCPPPAINEGFPVE